MKKKILLILLIIIIPTFFSFFVFNESKKIYKIERVEYSENYNTTPVYWKVGGSVDGSLKSYLNKILSNTSNVTKIEFNNISATGKKVTSDVSLDLSKDNDQSVMALVADDTLYIQYDGILYLNKDSSCLFYDLKNIQIIKGLQYINTSNVTDMEYMFYMFDGMSSLTELDLSSFDTSNVTDMSMMFDGMSSLTKLDVSNFDTSNVTDMRYMFAGMGSLTKLDLSSFDTSNVTDMSGMFKGMGSLTELDVSNFDTSNVTDMKYMFCGMSSLTELDVSSFDTSNVTDMSDMFQWMQSLTELDLSNFDTSNITDMGFMFYGMSSLTELDLSSFDTSNVTDMSGMFSEMSSLTELDVSSFDTSNVTDMRDMFAGMGSLTELDVSNFDTSNVTDMNFMFYDMVSLTELDVSSFDTSNVTDMRDMFAGMGSLTKLDLSNFDTSKVTNMGSMFYGMSSLTKLDLSNFDTSKVTNMGSMFYGMRSLTKLDVSNFDTSKVTYMSNMFYRMSSLTELDVSNFDTSNVTYMGFMFNDMVSLTELDLSNFDTSNVTGMKYMFRGMSSLTELDVSSFDTSNVTDMSDMFYRMKKLKKIYASEKFKIDTVEMYDQIFSYSSNLIGWNGTKYSDEQSENIEYARLDTPTKPGYFSAKVTSDEYLVNDEYYYVYIGNNSITNDIVDKITTSYGEGKIEDNKYNIYYEDELVKSFDIVNISSDSYDLSNETIKVNDDTIDEFIEKINCTNCEVKIYDGEKYLTEGEFTENNTLRVMYEDKVLKEYNLLFHVSGVSLNQENVRLGLDRKNTVQLEAVVTPKNAENKNVSWTSSNKEVATVDDNGLVTSVGLGNATITVTTEEGGFTDTVDVEVVDIITYQITYKDGENIYVEEYEEDEVVSLKDALTKNGYTLIGWKLNDKEYKLNDEFIMGNEDITLEAVWELVIPDIEKTSGYKVKDNLITGISLGSNVSDINLGLESFYTVKIYDKKDIEKQGGVIATSDKLKIYLDELLVSEYVFVVKGDVTGTGTSTISDVAKLYQYLKKKIDMEECYKEAGNVVDSDNEIKINDVAKLYQFIKKKIESLEG